MRGGHFSFSGEEIQLGEVIKNTYTEIGTSPNALTRLLLSKQRDFTSVVSKSN